MAEVPFRLKLSGSLADQHLFEGYDGYMGLAGFARTLTLIAHYAETGKIRQKGDFEGRHAVLAGPLERGSLIADFSVRLNSIPAAIFGGAASDVSRTELFQSLVKRVFDLNLGNDIDYNYLDKLDEKTSGNIETLAAVTEAPIRQFHSIIGAGATKAEVISGVNLIETINQQTKDYVLLDYFDEEVICKNVNIFSFDANSGYGRLFDFEKNRSIPFTMNRENILKYRRIFSWGLDQYTNRSGKLVHVCFKRTLLMDGRPKRYHITHAVKGAH